MPPRDANRLQLDFPDLAADIIRELRIQGTVGLPDFNDSVQPVYIVSSRGGALDVTAEPNIFASAEIFSDETVTPAVNGVLADTGQLAAGVFDVKVVMSWAAFTGPGAVTGRFEFQHRNAANAANLSEVPIAWITDTGFRDTQFVSWTFATVVATNERFRIQNFTGIASARVGTTIMAARRAEP